MYSKHLKMARGEGEHGIRSHFVERVVKLPMVHVAWDYATLTYAHIKESNKLVNFTLTNAEKSVTFVAGQAKPVVMRFERQIQAVDNLACKGLGTLEEKVPFIRKPADEIMTDTRNLYTSTVYSRLEGIKRYGTDKVKSVADYSLEKANAILGKEVVDSLLNTVDGALVITETYVDRILPPTEEEKKKANKEDTQTGLSRVVDLPRKILHRTQRTLVLKFEYIQEKGIDLLLYPIGMIEVSKGHLENLLQYVNEIWESLKGQRTETDGEKIIRNAFIEKRLCLFPILEMSPIYSSHLHSAAISTAKDRVLWVIGIIRVIPQLLPMYIYGFVSWLNQKRGIEEESRQADGSVKQNGELKHQTNNSSNNHCANHSSKSRAANCHSNHHGENDVS